ncbi:MAG: glycerate kinase, partial [Candidatus Colwellbacteria bacterium CG_4_9_14_0_2_um_filter_50_12]
MIIKNLRKLGSTSLRKSALSIAEAGIKAVLPKNIIRDSVSVKGDLLRIKNRQFDLKNYRRLFIFAFGKAAADSAHALEKILGDRIAGGVVIDVKTYKSKRLKVFAADHPLPTERNIKAGRELVKMLESFGKFTEKDIVLTVISGGASVLLCRPHQLTHTKLGVVVSALLKRGADIKEINIIRKHLSLIHGGYFAKYVYPAKTIALLYSDVPTSDLSVIASGPTFRDSTTVKDARRIAKKYGL